MKTTLYIKPGEGGDHSKTLVNEIASAFHKMFAINNISCD